MLNPMSRPAIVPLLLIIDHFPTRLNDSTTCLSYRLQVTTTTNAGCLHPLDRGGSPDPRVAVWYAMRPCLSESRLTPSQFAICAGGCIATLWVMDKMINKEGQREAKRASACSLSSSYSSSYTHFLLSGVRDADCVSPGV